MHMPLPCLPRHPKTVRKMREMLDIWGGVLKETFLDVAPSNVSTEHLGDAFQNQGLDRAPRDNEVTSRCMSKTEGAGKRWFIYE